jgi:hypothetical protein
VRAHAVASEHRRQLSETVQNLIQRGYFDRVAADPDRLLEAIAGRPLGGGMPSSDPAAALPGAEPSAWDDEPEFVPNEDDG